MAKLLIFGGTGALGSAIAEKFAVEGYEVTFGVRKITNPANQFLLPITDGPVPELLKGQLFDAVVFAQGANINDSVITSSLDDLNKLFGSHLFHTWQQLLPPIRQYRQRLIILALFLKPISI